MKRLEKVKQRIAAIKNYNGMELVLASEDVKMRGGLLTFNIVMNTNFQNMERYKLNALARYGFIEKTEDNGHNRVLVYFK